MTSPSSGPTGIPRAAAEGFERGAADYEASRPSYPAAALACIVGHAGLGPGTRVLDLAAGTGKLTRLLVPSGADVVAVEPVAGMRAQLRQVLPEVVVEDGTAEAIPFDDESFDAVTVAQAFHWFEPTSALAEMRRVLRPNGSLLLIWNTRDRSVDWVRAWGDLLTDEGADRPYDNYHDVDYPAVVASAGGFSAVDSWTGAWDQPCDPELLVQRSASVSVVAALDDADREVVLERVRNLAETHPQLAGLGTFAFPYTTSVFWCRKI